MNNFVKLALATSLLTISSAAYADSVLFAGKVIINGKPFQLRQAESGFRPTNDVIEVKIAGKTCTFGSSTLGSVPRGCNYTVRITPDGIDAVAREASNTCMRIPANCR